MIDDDGKVMFEGREVQPGDRVKIRWTNPWVNHRGMRASAESPEWLVVSRHWNGDLVASDYALNNTNVKILAHKVKTTPITLDLPNGVEIERLRQALPVAAIGIDEESGRVRIKSRVGYGLRLTREQAVGLVQTILATVGVE